MAKDLMRRYRSRVIFGPFAAVDPREIQALESEIGCRLPAPYRAFLEAAHGGSLKYSIRLPSSVGGEAIEFGDLHRAGRDQRGGYGYGTLLGEYRRRSQCRQAEKATTGSLLPIARDGDGDTLYLEFGGQAPGRLVAFVRGLPSWTGLTEHDTLTVVCDSFDAYLDSLFIEDDIAHMTWDDVKDAYPSDPWRSAVETWLDDGLPGWRGRPWAAQLPDRRHVHTADSPTPQPWPVPGVGERDGHRSGTASAASARVFARRQRHVGWFRWQEPGPCRRARRSPLRDFPATEKLGRGGGTTVRSE